VINHRLRYNAQRFPWAKKLQIHEHYESIPSYYAKSCDENHFVH